MVELAERLGQQWGVSSWRSRLKYLGQLAKRPVVGPRVAMTLAGVAILVISTLLVLRGSMVRVQYAAALVKIAGRQMMLSQKMAYQAYMIASGHDDDRFHLQQSVGSFDRLLEVMEKGGWALDTWLPKPPKNVLLEARALSVAWVPYRERLLTIARGAPENPAVRSALQYIDDHSDILLAADFGDYLRTIEGRANRIALGLIGFHLVFLSLVVGFAWAGASRRAKKFKALRRELREERRSALLHGKKRDDLSTSAFGAREIADERQGVVAAADTHRACCTILSSIPCGLLIVDARTRISWANEGASKALLVSPELLVGSTVSEILGTDQVRLQAAAARESGRPVAASYLGVSPSDRVSQRVRLITVTALVEERTACQNLLVLIRDITNEVGSERGTAEAVNSFKTLVEDSVDAVVAADRKGRITYVNGAAEKMFGWERDDLVGQGIAMLMPEKFRGAHTKALQRVALTGKAALAGSMLRVDGLDKSGRVFPVEMSLSVVRVGSSPSFVAMMRDVTDRQRAVEAVTRSEARFRSLSEQLPDAVVVQQEAQVVYANPAALQLLGLDDASAILGRPMAALIWREDRGIWNEVAEQASSTQSRLPPRELRVLAYDGTAIDVEAVVLPIEFDHKPAIASVFRDVRERKQLQAQLMHADRMASMGTLAAGIAHEINNPVGFVHSNLGALEKYVSRLTELVDFYDGLRTRDEIAQDSALQELLREALEKRKSLKIDYILKDIPKLIARSKEGTERIKKIVSDLKSFARSDDGLGDVDVNQTIELALNIAWNEIKYKAEVVRNLGDLPRLKGDSTALGQVFLNILVNAAQAIAEKGTITVETSSSNGSVLVRISDTGSGIPRQHLGKIFEPFFTTKPPGKGTGLGLNIAYNIVRRHKGEIKVYSEPGQGTTFTIELPVGDSQ